MSKDKLPVTPAIRVLRAEGVEFTTHPYTYEERGGTEVSARELGVPEQAVIKTLIMEDEAKRPMPIYLERTIAALPYLYVNGGRRGFLVGMTPADLIRALNPILVDAATVKGA
jgi:prolyl-tRNA editing enzyme YbaK/EbsC (Cys-tRNA(Pro) deacylase)